MKNEYLFLSNDDRETIETYHPDNIVVEISQIDDTPLWIASYFINGNNKDCANRLSEVHTILMQHSPLVLSCESSEYYNRTLFPLINELERKLRKLLYLATSISDNKKAKESINRLEEKDFGTIFDLLFIDPNFINELKERINADSKSRFNGQSKYSKDEIMSYLKSLDEHTLWDAILSQQDVSTLRGRFRDVRAYRNDVMHAHNISKESFGKAYYLFNKVNEELDIAIIRLMGNSKEVPIEQKSDVSTAISSALTAMDISAMADALGISSQVLKATDDLQPLKITAALTNVIKNIQSPIVQPDIEGIKQQLTRLGSLIQSYVQIEHVWQSYDALQNSLRSISTTLLPSQRLNDAITNEHEIRKSEEDKESDEQQKTENANP